VGCQQARLGLRRTLASAAERLALLAAPPFLATPLPASVTADRRLCVPLLREVCPDQWRWR